MFTVEPRGITNLVTESGTNPVAITDSILRGIQATLLETLKAIICAGAKCLIKEKGFRPFVKK